MSDWDILEPAAVSVACLIAGADGFVCEDEVEIIAEKMSSLLGEYIDWEDARQAIADALDFDHLWLYVVRQAADLPLNLRQSLHALGHEVMMINEDAQEEKERLLQEIATALGLRHAETADGSKVEALDSDRTAIAIIVFTEGFRCALDDDDDTVAEVFKKAKEAWAASRNDRFHPGYRQACELLSPLFTCGFSEAQDTYSFSTTVNIDLSDGSKSIERGEDGFRSADEDRELDEALGGMPSLDAVEVLGVDFREESSHAPLSADEILRDEPEVALIAKFRGQLGVAFGSIEELQEWLSGREDEVYKRFSFEPAWAAHGWSSGEQTVIVFSEEDVNEGWSAIKETIFSKEISAELQASEDEDNGDEDDTGPVDLDDEFEVARQSLLDEGVEDPSEAAVAQRMLGNILNDLGSSLRAVEIQNEGVDAYRAGDFDRARELYLQAAEMGSMDAQYNLGQMCMAGEGFDQDWNEAVQWWVKSGERGMLNAQRNAWKAISQRKAKGVGDEVAYRMAALAAEQGDQESLEFLETFCGSWSQPGDWTPEGALNFDEVPVLVAIRDMDIEYLEVFKKTENSTDEVIKLNLQNQLGQMLEHFRGKEIDSISRRNLIEKRLGLKDKGLEVWLNQPTREMTRGRNLFSLIPRTLSTGLWNNLERVLKKISDIPIYVEVTPVLVAICFALVDDDNNFDARLKILDLFDLEDRGRYEGKLLPASGLGALILLPILADAVAGGRDDVVRELADTPTKDAIDLALIAALMMHETSIDWYHILDAGAELQDAKRELLEKAALRGLELKDKRLLLRALEAWPSSSDPSEAMGGEKGATFEGLQKATAIIAEIDEVSVSLVEIEPGEYRLVSSAAQTLERYEADQTENFLLGTIFSSCRYEFSATSLLVNSLLAIDPSKEIDERQKGDIPGDWPSREFTFADESIRELIEINDHIKTGESDYYPDSDIGSLFFLSWPSNYLIYHAIMLLKTKSIKTLFPKAALFNFLARKDDLDESIGRVDSFQQVLHIQSEVWGEAEHAIFNALLDLRVRMGLISEQVGPVALSGQTYDLTLRRKIAHDITNALITYARLRVQIGGVEDSTNLILSVLNRTSNIATDDEWILLEEFGISESSSNGQRLKVLEALLREREGGDVMPAVEKERLTTTTGSFVDSEGIDSEAHPVLIASMEGDVVRLQALLSEGYSATDIDEVSGTDAVIIAAREGHLDVVEILLDAGADPNRMNPETGTAPLRMALQERHVEIVELLLKRGADPDLRRLADGTGPLTMLANRAGGYPDGEALRLLNLLFAEGARLHSGVQVDEMTASDLCLASFTPSLPSGFLSRMANEAEKQDLDLALWFATSVEEIPKNLEDLIACGANVNMSVPELEYDPSSVGDCPLNAAATRGYGKNVKLLIDAGADVNQNAPPEGGQFPLLMAAENGHLEIVEMLLEAGAEVSMTNPENGTTPLGGAVLRGHSKIVSLLLKAGADPNRQTEGYGGPIITFAAHEGYVDIVRSLINHGADVDAAGSEYGNTALILASNQGNVEMVELLLRSGADPGKVNPVNGSDALLAAIVGENAQCAKLLLEAGADPNRGVSINGGDVPLLIAASDNGYAEIVRLLVVHGAELDATDGDGLTALQRAGLHEHKDVEAVLIELGADPEKRFVRFTDTPAGQELQKEIISGFADSVDRVQEALRDLEADAVAQEKEPEPETRGFWARLFRRKDGR